MANKNTKNHRRHAHKAYSRSKSGGVVATEMERMRTVPGKSAYRMQKVTIAIGPEPAPRRKRKAKVGYSAESFCRD